jgi:membrane protein YdbS with pleckstrin-like domain
MAQSYSVIRQNIIFLVFKLLLIEFVLIASYVLLDLPLMLLVDADSSTVEFETQADFYGISLLFILSMIEMIVIIVTVLRWYNSQWEINKDDIIQKKGLISIQESVDSFRNFTGVTVHQGIFGRIFNYGTIKLFNPALDHSITIKNVSSPTKYKNLIAERLPKSDMTLINKK